MDMRDPALNRLKGRRRSRHFLKAWLRSPMKMGALVPSSRALARAIARQIDVAQEGIVVELGAGTGVVTHALLEVVDPARLLIIERDVSLHKLLAAHYPMLEIACADALALDKILHDRPHASVNAIVSSLPLLSMPRELRRGIIEQMALAIGDTGSIIQYTYGPTSPISKDAMEKCGLRGKKVKIVMANVPPAQIWVYSKV